LAPSQESFAKLLKRPLDQTSQPGDPPQVASGSGPPDTWSDSSFEDDHEAKPPENAQALVAEILDEGQSEEEQQEEAT
jgi:hypothetical protein